MKNLTSLVTTVIAPLIHHDLYYMSTYAASADVWLSLGVGDFNLKSVSAHDHHEIDVVSTLLFFLVTG